MKILSLTESYSMQPNSVYVGMIWNGTGKGEWPKVAEIKEENVSIEGDPFAFYVGYDDRGNRLFEFRKGTVNVYYFPEPTTSITP